MSCKSTQSLFYQLIENTLQTRKPNVEQTPLTINPRFDTTKPCGNTSIKRCICRCILHIVEFFSTEEIEELKWFRENILDADSSRHLYIDAMKLRRIFFNERIRHGAHQRHIIPTFLKYAHGWNHKRLHRLLYR